MIIFLKSFISLFSYLLIEKIRFGRVIYFSSKVFVGSVHKVFFKTVNFIKAPNTNPAALASLTVSLI